jgi:DNA-binding CsgD family transcriptional regulator
MGLGDAAGALDDALRARAIAAGGDPSAYVAVVHGAALLMNGEVAEARPLLGAADALARECEDGWESTFASDNPLRPGRWLTYGAHETGAAFNALLAGGQTERAVRLAAAAIEWGRPRGANYGYIQAMLSRIEFERGEWTSAWSNAREGLGRPEEGRYHLPLWWGSNAAAELAAARGMGEEVERYTEEGAQAEAGWGSMASIAVLGGGGPGLLALGLGRYEDAADAYERLVLPRVAQLKLYPQFADAIEALARAGRTPHALKLFEELEEQAHASGWTWALARTAHLEAILEPSEAAFDKALDLQQQAERPFPRARSRLAYGQWLRRRGRRVDARTQLRAALETFEHLGAEPWAEQARAELRATGERVRKRTPSAMPELTPQELQVAAVVARGATNKEAAAQLYLSPKTIEKHLGGVYAKLGLRSRTELARVFADEERRTTGEPSQV